MRLCHGGRAKIQLRVSYIKYILIWTHTAQVRRIFYHKVVSGPPRLILRAFHFRSKKDKMERIERSGVAIEANFLVNHSSIPPSLYTLSPNGRR